MICGRRWTVSLWCLSGLISMITPCNSTSTNRRKGSVFVSDDNLFQRSYRLEDFFWTGSGDGPVLEDSFSNDTIGDTNLIQDEFFDSWRTTTVFHTTTILFATVYPNSASCSENKCRPRTSPVWTGSIEFSSPAYPATFEIEPTPTQKHFDTSRGAKNVTIFSEITKVLTITERVTPSGKDVRVTPAKTLVTGPQTTILTGRNFTKGFDPQGGEDEEGEEDGLIFPRFDADQSSTSATVEYEIPADQRYWLLTVLKRDNYSPELKVSVMEEKLSALYRKAFIRQQEKHLGISNGTMTTFRPRRDRRISEPVRVHIHNVSDSVGGEPNEIGLLYSVTVAGTPIPALTAANDMRLMTMNEVVAELGYPILTKAEPYVKSAVPLGARVKGRTRDTWLLIGSVIAAVCLLIILAALFTFGLSHRGGNRNSSGSANNNKRHVFEAEEGTSNAAFQEDADLKVKSSRRHVESSKLEKSKAAENPGGTTVTFSEQQRRGSSSSSSCSGSSEASLVRLRHQQRKKEQRKELVDEKPRPRPRTRIRRVENAGRTLVWKEDANRGTGSSGLSRDQDSCGGMMTEGLDDIESTPRVTRTPTSYLSMPSVKAFPRGAKIPEPLSRVLEPISIRHLDGDPDSFPRPGRNKVLDEDYEIDYLHGSQQISSKSKGMTRHASLEGDPGVIGPIVWKRHRLRTDSSEKGTLDMSEIDGTVNIGKMRRRFNDLIDDAFSMFGSRNDSLEEKDKIGEEIAARPTGGRVHSAATRTAESFYYFGSSDRPKTAGSKRPLTAVNQGPRGAWGSPSCSLASKITVASSPTIDKCSVLVDSNLSPGDPAIPLIKAIKDELQKFDQTPEKCTHDT